MTLFFRRILLELWNCCLRGKAYLISGLSFLWELLCLSGFIWEGKQRKRFIESAANAEICALKKSNRKYRIYKYNLYVRGIDWIERHTFKATIISLLLIVSSYWLTIRFPAWSFPKERLPDIVAFQTFTTGIQATLSAVVVPFSVVILEFVFRDYCAKLELIRLIHKETKLWFLTVSSIILTIVIFSSQYFGVVLEVPNNLAAVTITSVWFIINTIGTGYFIITGLQLLIPTYRYRALVKFVANEVYPNEIKKYLTRNIYFNVFARNKEEERYVEPEVHCFIPRDCGQPVVTCRLPSEKYLADIDLSFLKYIVKRWKKRNQRLRREDEHHSRSTKLIFPLEVGCLYNGETTLCRADREGKLSLIDKWLIKRAFIFRTPQNWDERNTQNIENSIKILNETVIRAIRALSKDQFEVAYGEYQNFHLLLLELGETRSNRESINYGIIESFGLGEHLYQEWARSYHNIFDESVAVLPQRNDFFRTCCYTAYHLIDNIFFIPSMELNSVIDSQGYLWFRFNEWWCEQVEKQRCKEHHNSAPTELLPPEAKIYEDAMRHFVGAWEAIQSIIISKADKHTQTWKDYRSVFMAFDCHLKEILLFVARAVLSGNRHAAKETAEMLMRWYGHISISLHEYDSDYWLMHGIKTVRATPYLFEQSWNQVEQILADENGFHKNSEKSLFKAILFNYWQDVSALLASFLINWSLTAAQANPMSTPLSLEILDKLLKGSLDDNANNHSRSTFAKNLRDFLIIFLRQNTCHHWAKGSYQADLSEICRKIDSLTEPAQVSGRIYSRHGDPIDSIKTPFIILGLLLADENEGNVLSKSVQDFLGIMLEDDEAAQNLERALKKHIESMESINLAEIDRMFSGFLSAEKTASNVTADNITSEVGNAETTATEATYVRYERRREQVKQLFVSLQQFICEYRTKKIQALPVSDTKMMKIAEDASLEAFNKETAEFPVDLFKEVKFTTKCLPERKLANPHYPKGMLTEPVMDEVHYGKKWHSELIASFVYAYLIFSIFDKAKTNQQVENSTATTQQEYADLLLEKAKLLKESGLTPIIIVETSRTPGWLDDWGLARWDRQIQLPFNIIIERKEKRKRGGYLFHVNDVPVYEAKALIQGTLVMAEETFQKVTFRRFDNGYPVDVTYQIDPNNPCYGTLMYEWQRDVVLGNEKVFFITYPQAMSEE